jgi:hypothetical protein
MQARSRSQDLRTPKTGTYYNRLGSPPLVTLTKLTGRSKTCDDVIGNKDAKGKFLPNGLTIIQWHRRISAIDGTLWLSPGVLNKQFIGYPIDYSPNPPTPLGKYPIPTSTELSNYAWETIAKTNPNAPNVSVPAFIGELKDVPDLVKDWGGSILRKIAKGHLSWRWGIKPMISDVRKMIDFTRLVDKRVKELTRLRDAGVLRSRTGLSSASTMDPAVSVFFHSNGAIVKGKKTITYTSKVWGSVERKLSPGTSLPLTNDGMRKLATRLVYGITSYEVLTAAWELLPWSWFVDWFAGLGTVIAANNNTVSMSWQRLCIMRTTSAKASYDFDKAASDSWVSLEGVPQEEEVRKIRIVNVNPTLPVLPTLLPLVEGKTWSILGSIAILRKK